MNDLLTDLRFELRRYKNMADKAMVNVDDQDFFRRPAELVNSIAVIIKHLAGNFQSRWSDFLTTDGEKPTRNRDGEFVITDQDTRASLQAAWEQGWKTLLDTLDQLRDGDLEKSVTIRGESHRVPQALLRGFAHAAYHIGQIVYLVRLWRPDSPWLTIPPGKSQQVGGGYFKPR